MISRKPENCWSAFNGRAVADGKAPYKFAHSRTALRYGMTAYGLGVDDEVLLPSRTCHTLLEPFDRLGILYSLYEGFSDFSPDWSDIAGRLTSRTRAIVMIHYFGVPQNTAEFRQFCSEHGLRLIEDNAHGFGGQLDGRQLGCFGDIGFTSPYKTFGTFNGSYLYLRNRELSEMPALGLEPVSLRAKRITYAVRRFIQDHPLLKGMIVRPQPYSSQDSFRSAPIPGWRMDRKTHEFLSSQNLVLVREARHAVYAIWRKWTQDLGLTSVFKELPQSCLPMAFPAYCNSVSDRDAWFRWGYRNGVDVYSWPTLPRQVASGSRSYDDWKRMVCFPVHQDVDQAGLRAMLERVSAP